MPKTKVTDQKGVRRAKTTTIKKKRPTVRKTREKHSSSSDSYVPSDDPKSECSESSVQQEYESEDGDITAPVMKDGEEKWQVESLLDHRIRKKQSEFLVCLFDRL